AAMYQLGVRLVARLNDLSACINVGGVAVLVAALASFAPHQPARFLLQRNGSGQAFAVGLLLACWTFTGYDASAHVSEETHDPTRNAPNRASLRDRKSTRLNSSHLVISYAGFCLKKKKMPVSMNTTSTSSPPILAPTCATSS